jgi:hypothetical protein
LSLLRRRLVAGGVLAVWSAMAAPAFEAALRKLFVSVQVHLVEVPRGDPDHVYVASVPSGYRRAPSGSEMGGACHRSSRT